jgi:hypothetical protein
MVAVSCDYQQVHHLRCRYHCYSNATALRVERGIAREKRLCVGEQPARDLRCDRLKFPRGLGVPPAEERLRRFAGNRLCFGRRDMEQRNLRICGDELLRGGDGRLPCALNDPDHNTHLTLPAV